MRDWAQASPSAGFIETESAGEVLILSGDRIDALKDRLIDGISSRGCVALSYHPGWSGVFERSLGHEPYLLVAMKHGEIRGHLALSFVNSALFGRFLVSLPYLNYGGVWADDPELRNLLIDAAVDLAVRLDVKYLELRHEQRLDHPALGHTLAEKVNMHLALPATPEALWAGLPSKVRNQVRKAEKQGLEIAWGGLELLDDFYQVFSRNMRDLGTPTYGKVLFREMLCEFSGQSEICVVRTGRMTIAGAVLLHGWKMAEVPSASSLRSHNHLNANMLLYCQLLFRSIERQHQTFDFGRSTRDSSTYRFKSQWGARPVGSAWQYCLQRGSLKDARPDNPRYRRLIRIWRRLPVALTRLIGPMVIRGVP